MTKFLNRMAPAIAGAAALLAAQPAAAETINLVCTYTPFDGYTDVEMIWADTATSKVRSVMSLQDWRGMHGIKGGGNAEDALHKAQYPSQVRTWPATITATSIKWTSNLETPRPVEINRTTGVLTWSTPEDPTPPSKGSAQCTVGTYEFPKPIVTPSVKPH